MRITSTGTFVPFALLIVASCARTVGEEPVAPATDVPAASSAVAASPAAGTAPAEAGQEVVVHKSPSCGCCGKWVDHLRAEGFAVKVVDTDDLGAVKEALAVPPEQASCHPATVGGYVVEGHVPASDIRRLLAEKPAARGLAVPGMPAGSPGMEVPSGQVDAYDTLLLGNDGRVTVFSQHGGS